MKKSIKKIYSNRLLWSFCVFGVTIILFLFGLHFAGRRTDAERLKITKSAIVRAVVSCYALEGTYPPDIDYLEKNYGLLINHKQFFISYDVFSSNIMPNIDVFLTDGVNT